MALPEYPTELCKYIAVHEGGLQTTIANNRLVTKPARGRPWIRGAPSADGGRIVQISSWPMPLWHVARLWRFWREDLAEGTKPFRLRNQQTDGKQVLNEEGAPVLDEDGTPVLNTAFWICLFPETPPPEEKITRTKYRMRFPLLVIQE